MSMPLRVLLIEDNELDAELEIQHLQKAGYQVLSQRIATAEAMRDALNQVEWDIIISDYSLPGFDAQTALRIWSESGKDIPFIIVSGTITEETAIDLMRAGASDYLLKDRLARLGPLVKRELNIAQVRKERNETQAALRKEELYLRAILQTATDGFVMLDKNRNIVDANKAYCEMTGYTLDELKQMNVNDLDVVENPSTTVSRLQRLMQEGADRFESRHRRKDGGIFHVEVSVTYVDESGGWFICFCRDITERKQTEAGLENRLIALTRPLDQPEEIDFEDLFDLSAIQRLQDEFSTATGVASIITYPDGTPITRPSNFCRLCSEIIRKTEVGQSNCFKSDATLGRYRPEGPIIQPCMSGGLWDAGAGISVGGRHIANWLIGQVRDETNEEKNIRAYARMIGADETAVVEAFSEVPAMSQARFRHVAQALFTMANQISTIAYQNVQQARFITEQQRVEEEVQRWGQIFQSAEWGIVVGSADGGTIELMNPAFAKMHGYSPEEMQGCAIPDLFAPECRKDIAENVQFAREKGHHIWESRHLHKDGHTFPVLIDVTSVKNEKGQPKYHVINVQDITERKQAEDQLNKQLEELRRWHAVTLGREKRILELKSEVNKLLQKDGLPIRYASAKDDADE